MPKIAFTVCTDEKSFDPELIAALKEVGEDTNLSPLYDKYGKDSVIDAMLTLDEDVNPDSDWYIMGEDTIEDWLWDEFYENCFPYIEDVFRTRYKKRKLP